MLVENSQTHLGRSLLFGVHYYLLQPTLLAAFAATARQHSVVRSSRVTLVNNERLPQANQAASLP